MKRTLIALVTTTMFIGGPLRAQDHEPSDGVRTAAPAESRFEVLQSGSGGTTFRLDKRSGQVWTLHHVSSLASTKAVWTAIPSPRELEETPGPAAVNYQLFHSIRTGRTLLLDVHTGDTWLLRGASGRREWQPVVPER